MGQYEKTPDPVRRDRLTAESLSMLRPTKGSRREHGEWCLQEWMFTV